MVLMYLMISGYSYSANYEHDNEYNSYNNEVDIWTYDVNVIICPVATGKGDT